jgi:hypothetical protein
MIETPRDPVEMVLTHGPQCDPSRDSPLNSSPNDEGDRLDLPEARIVAALKSRSRDRTSHSQLIFENEAE